jgi:hypothetical protein
VATWLKAKITARERWLLALFLALALARGLIYVALVPPWQASDEPYHLLTGMAINLDNAPDTPARWAQTQQEMVASLIQFNWWD